MPLYDEGAQSQPWAMAEILQRDKTFCSSAMEVIRQAKAFMEDAATEAGTDAHKDHRYELVQRWLELNDVIYRRSAERTKLLKDAMQYDCLKCAADMIHQLFKDELPQIRIGHLIRAKSNGGGPLGMFHDNTHIYREMTAERMGKLRDGDWVKWSEDQVFTVVRRK